jgi:hypothetical protein
VLATQRGSRESDALGGKLGHTRQSAIEPTSGEGA